MKKCEKCGKIYSEDDLNDNAKNLDVCHCGGKLVFIQPLIGHITDEIDPINEFTLYPEVTPLDKEDKEKALNIGIKAKARLKKSKK